MFFREIRQPYPVGWREIPELFAEADVVTLHCNLTPENTGLVNKVLLRTMKQTAYLINTSRGPLIRDADLAEALHAGWIGAQRWTW